MVNEGQLFPEVVTHVMTDQGPEGSDPNVRRAAATSPPRFMQPVKFPAPQLVSSTPLVRLAWRNMWRHRQRTILLLVVVAYATFFSICYWSIMDGYGDSVVESYARYIVAPVQIASDAWYGDPDPQNHLPDPVFAEALDTLRAIPQVRAAAPRLQFPALLQSAYTSQGVEVRGVDPGAERSVSRIPAKIEEGRWLEGPGEVVLGRGIARRIDARVGEHVVVSVASLAGQQAMGLQVVGLAATGVAALDESVVLTTLEDARNLTGVPTATTIALDVPRGSEEAAAARAQGALPPGLTALGVWDLVGPIKTDVQANKAFAFVLAVIVYVFAALAVTTTITVSVMERTRELGVIAALGLAPRRRGALVTREAVFSCGLGWLAGLAAGYAAAWCLARYNILGPIFAMMSASFPATGLSEEVYGAVRAAYAGYSGMVVAAALILSALMPGRRAARLRPAEAMRSE